MTRHINEQRGLVVAQRRGVAPVVATQGSSPEAACEAQLSVLAAVQENKKLLGIDTTTWTHTIVDMAIATVQGRPELWAAALRLCIALDGFWNTKFADTATKSSVVVTKWKGKRMTRETVMTEMNKNRKKEPENPTWLDLVFEKIPNATKVYTSYSGLQGDDKGNAIWDIRYDTEKRPVPDHLQHFVSIMKDLENFTDDFCIKYNTFKSVIARQGEYDNAIGTLLDLKTKGNYGDFGMKARAAVLFLKTNRQKLRDAGVTGPTSTGQIARLNGLATADMSAVTGHVPWSTGIPPNTPTLVVMQRLLMRLSDDLT